MCQSPSFFYRFSQGEGVLLVRTRKDGELANPTRGTVGKPPFDHNLPA